MLGAVLYGAAPSTWEGLIYIFRQKFHELIIEGLGGASPI